MSSGGPRARPSWPRALSPQHFTIPLVSRAQPKLAPKAISATFEASGTAIGSDDAAEKESLPTCPCPPHPQQLTVPVSRSAQENISPPCTLKTEWRSCGSSIGGWPQHLTVPSLIRAQEYPYTAV